MPYIEFPSDINNIIGNGISFGFIRTNGANGNISAATLAKMSASGITMTLSSGEDIDCEDD